MKCSDEKRKERNEAEGYWKKVMELALSFSLSPESKCQDCKKDRDPKRYWNECWLGFVCYFSLFFFGSYFCLCCSVLSLTK